MPEQLERVARPSAVLDNPGVLPARGINRNNLTLCLSVTAVILSVASASVNLYIYLDTNKRKLTAEAGLAEAQKKKEEALAVAAQYEAELKKQQTRTSNAEEQAALAAKRDHDAAARNHQADAALKVQEERSEKRRAVASEGILTDEIVGSLARSAHGAANGGLTGASPGRPMFDAMPITSGARATLGPGQRADQGKPAAKRTADEFDK